jgi:uncharacterized RDD family membrane protein YckC
MRGDMMNSKTPASFLSRVLASLLDGILVSVVAVILASIFQLNQTNTSSFEQLLRVAYMLLLPLFWYGYTIGKKSLGIRIVRKDGREISFFNSFLRAIGSLLYLLPAVIGFFVSFGSEFSHQSVEYYFLLFLSGVFPIAFVIGAFLTVIIFFTSVSMVAFRDDRRAIHDFLAGTCVIKVENKTKNNDIL